MAYRKFKADGIFTGREILENDSVLISSEDGSIKAVIAESEAGEDVQTLGGILCPGLINCHCHLELSHLKGVIPRGTGLTDFVFKVITQRHFRQEEIDEAIIRAENEMLANGIVAAGDICNSPDSLFQKQKQHLFYYNFIETSGWDPALATARFEKSRLFYEQFSQLPPPYNQAAMAPHASYSVSNELWHKILPFSAHKTTTIHNQETAFEDELFKKGTGDLLRMYEMMHIDIAHFKPSGKSSLQTHLPKLEGAKNILLVHNSFTSEEDLQFCQSPASHDDPKRGPGPPSNAKLFFCLCVNANQYIENALPPLELFRKYNCRIVLGTDSLASNRSLNILDEIKTIIRQFPTIPHPEILRWATIQGAQALELDPFLGSFDAGKKPGIILIENTRGACLTGSSSIRRIL
jgi:aminodeoxyfutalosine deaminase